jgi:probable HAF family extracellular repeat protein
MSDLGTLGANNISGYSSAHAINRNGQVVGESSVSFSQVSTIHAVLFANGSKTDLGALGGNYSAANALNNLGVIVGESDIVQQGVTNVHGFVYVAGGPGMSDLGTLGGNYSSARGVNDAGVVVGEAETVFGGASYLRAFVWTNGIMHDLGTLGGLSSSAAAINSAGLVVGYATDTNEVSNAFLYNGTRMVNLNEYLPPGSGWTNLASADAINDNGQIAGSGYLADGSYHGYLLSPAPGWLALAGPILLADGRVQLTVEGVPGEQYALLVSTNLADWNGVVTNTLSTAAEPVVDPAAADVTGRYYRALLLP